MQLYRNLALGRKMDGSRENTVEWVIPDLAKQTFFFLMRLQTLNFQMCVQILE